MSKQSPVSESAPGTESKVPGPAKNAPKEQGDDNKLRGAEEAMDRDLLTGAGQNE